MRVEPNLKEAIAYFQKNGFKRLFQGLQGRYNSLSRLGGTITIEALTEEEALALEGFLQLQCKENQNLTIGVAELRKKLRSTRFGGVELEELVPLVIGQGLISQREEQEQYESERKIFFETLQQQYNGTPAGNWLNSVFQTKSYTLSALYQDYRQCRNWLEQDFIKVLDSMNHLPIYHDKKELITVFAAKISGNPHFFDEEERALYYLLRAIHETLGYQTVIDNKIEAKTELLYVAGIVRDDLSNYVLTYGIQGYESDGRLHEGMEYYRRHQEPLLLTLRNLSILNNAGAKTNQVYIMENPAAFIYLFQNNPDISCICSAGQPRFALLVLLDLLVEGGSKLYYAGDYDPEGLRIAQNLKSRYGDDLVLWKYTKENYRKARSKVALSARRLRQLEGLKADELCLIADCLREYGVAGYQENMIEEYLLIK